MDNTPLLQSGVGVQVPHVSTVSCFHNVCFFFTEKKLEGHSLKSPIHCSLVQWFRIALLHSEGH